MLMAEDQAVSLERIVQENDLDTEGNTDETDNLSGASLHSDTQLDILHTSIDIKQELESLRIIEEPFIESGQPLESTYPDHELKYLKEYNRKKEIKLRTLLDRDDAVESYLSNTELETEALEFVENFRYQYALIFPGRKDLLLSPENEFGVKKFICTSIKPTRLPFKDLYDYRTCATFVANYITYAQLDPPYSLPLKVPSPSFTMQYQHGNSFDMSILLACLLRGAGYNAYVVSGYASRKITTMDDTRLVADVASILESYSTAKNEIDFEKVRREVVSVRVPNNKYRVKDAKELKSQFIKKQREKAIAAEAEAMKAQTDELEGLQQQRDEVDDDELSGLRIHAWVLILPGSREIAEPFFIESSTGRQYATSDTNFVGLESVFSSTNYWVNMQPCLNKLKDISLDLGDNSKWEFVFLGNTQPNATDVADEDEDDDKEPPDVLETPSSWVSNLVVTTEQFDAKCPTGCKSTIYRNAEVFNDYHRQDGMIARLTILETYNTRGEVHEMFKNRKDKLKKRIRIASEDTVIEHFNHCKQHHLKQHTIINGKTSELFFYDFARHDGLFSRTYLDKKIVEKYVQRDDYLKYRSVTFNDAEMKDIKKIAEKYLRNEAVPASRDIAKRTFFLTEDKMRLVYHLEEGNLFPVFREFKRPILEAKVGTMLQILDSFEPVTKRMLQTDLYELLRVEQLTWHDIKKMDREVKEFLSQRIVEEEKIILNVSILDTIRNEEVDPASEEKKKEQLKEEDEINSAELNYLSPYLISYADPQNLTKEEAASVRDACLKAHKDRIVERISIIQGRLDELNSEYQKRQLVYSKTSDTMSILENEEHMTFCNEILFRIHILEKRLVKETAPEKYSKLDKRIKADLKV